VTNPFVDPSMAPYLLGDPFPEPPERGRGIWKTLAKAMEKLDRLRNQQAAYDIEASTLRETLPAAKQRDREALGRALTAGEPEPTPEAAAVEAEMETNAARARALDPVIAKEQRRVVDLIQRCKEDWKKDLERLLADQAAVYRAAIVAMEQARDNLAEDVRLGGWLDVFPQTGGQPQTHQLPGPPDTVVAGPPFNEVRDALLRDSEQLPLRGPVRPPTKEYLRAMDRKKLVLERVDKDGNLRAEVFEGDTRAGWGVRDWIAREFKQ
jgi:hypothetical protein